MRNEFARNLDLAQAKIQYDEQCKKVLGDKNVLSWILQRTVREYAGMNREEIMNRGGARDRKPESKPGRNQCIADYGNGE